MKYFLLNKDDIKRDIDINPLLIKTKSYSKIKKYRTLLNKLQKLEKEILKELRETNNSYSDINNNLFIKNDGTEISCSDYNRIKPICLYDEQLQRIRAYNRTEIFKNAKLIGCEIVTK